MSDLAKHRANDHLIKDTLVRERKHFNLKAPPLSNTIFEELRLLVFKYQLTQSIM